MNDEPRRIQLSRKKGWRMPPNTVVVSRPTRWGNPFDVKTFGRAQSVAYYRGILTAQEIAPHWKKWKSRINLAELRGKNLACWCALDEPCHADVLLRMANAKRTEEPQEPVQRGYKRTAAQMDAIHRDFKDGASMTRLSRKHSLRKSTVEFIIRMKMRGHAS